MKRQITPPRRNLMRLLFFTLHSSLLVCTAATVAAQQPALDRQLEVTRAYTPKVETATKLPVEPNMVDTVRLRPGGTFSITPTAWPSTLPVGKFAPAQMSTASFKKRHPVYIRAGMGYPLASTFDLYYTPYTGNNHTTMGVFVNHRGSFDWITNDIGVRSDADEVYNGLGFFATRQFPKRYTLEGDISYDNRYYSYYGSGDELADGDIPAPQPRSRANTDDSFGSYDRSVDTYFIGKVGGTVSFGDTFTDMTHFNFRVWLKTGFTHTGTTARQADADFRVTMVRMLHRHHGVELTLSERGAVNLQTTSASAVSFSISPRYILSLNDLSVSAGFNVGYIRNGGYTQNDELRRQHLWRFAPAIDAKYNVAHGLFVPFLSVSSRLSDGSYEALSRRNPYLHVGQSGPTGTITDARIGASGNVKDVFTWRVSGGASWLRDYQIFVSEYDVVLTQEPSDPANFHRHYTPVMFAPVGTRGMLYTIGVELGMLSLKGFSASLSANWNKFDLRRDDPPADLPKYDATLSLSYSYRDIFTVSASAHLIGERKFLNSFVIDYRQPPSFPNTSIDIIGPVVDVSLKAEVRAMERLWVFVEGSNLAKQARYPYNHYRSSGVSFIAGVKVVF